MRCVIAAANHLATEGMQQSAELWCCAGARRWTALDLLFTTEVLDCRLVQRTHGVLMHCVWSRKRPEGAADAPHALPSAFCAYLMVRMEQRMLCE